MRTLRTRIHRLAITLALAAPAALSAQDEMKVMDFASGNTGTTYAVTAVGELRRGVISRVRITKHHVHMVPDGLISVSGGGSISGSILRGQISALIGFIEVNINVPAKQTLGSSITLNVGGTDPYPLASFKFFVVRKGLITSVAFNPNPAVSQGGTPIAVNVQGDDLGQNAGIALGCHTRNETADTDNSFSVTVTRQAGCAVTAAGEFTGLPVSSPGPFSFTIRSTAGSEPDNYATANGTKSFSLGPYAAPPAQPPSCPSSAPVGLPVVIKPGTNQLIVFGPGASPNQSITFIWHRHTDNATLPPNNEWLFTRPPSGGQFGTTQTVVDTFTNATFAVPGNYTVTLRAKNCGAAAPSVTISFQLAQG